MGVGFRDEAWGFMDFGFREGGGSSFGVCGIGVGVLRSRDQGSRALGFALSNGDLRLQRLDLWLKA